MGRGRVAAWKATPPSDTTTQKAQALATFDGALGRVGDDFYGQANFSRHYTDAKSLGERQELVKALFALDPRGGYFAPAGMETSVRLTLEAEKTMPNINLLAESKGLKTDELIILMALKIRVMCSHWRQQNESPNPIPAQKKARIHPFKHFREDASDDEEETPTLAYRHFDGKYACEMFTDGSSVYARECRAGTGGMIETIWANSAVMELEVPNAMLKDGEIIVSEPSVRKQPAAAPKKKKLQKKKGTYDDEGEEEYADAEEAKQAA